MGRMHGSLRVPNAIYFIAEPNFQCAPEVSAALTGLAAVMNFFFFLFYLDLLAQPGLVTG